MSLDPGGFRTSSPASSGRASPVSRFRTPANEDGVNLKDKVYRRYALGVERALGSFDTAQQEWADYISFLSRLLKALQAHPAGCNVVPESQLVATRLAQCLKPSLPSGVHQKALEVYAFVFSTTGPESLARDLYLYFPGLSPVLSFASLGVRPLFLSLFEDNILLLNTEAIRPALKSIILCLLPGLEDETSEDFDRVLHTLDRFRASPAADAEKGHKGAVSGVSASSDSFFWQCFFLASVTSPSRRQGALAYLTRHLPKFGTRRTASHEEDMKTLTYEAQSALSPEPGLLIRCFAAGLSDQQLLVQRGFLDLLVLHLPLDSAVLQRAVPPADLDRLVFAAIGVVARRDMGLNRRLWTWFLGPEPRSDPEKAGIGSSAGISSPSMDASRYHAAYFAKYGLEALTRSVLAMFGRENTTAALRSRPFRICLSLMDRWEVGGLLIPHIVIPALRNAFVYCQRASKVNGDEVLKSASNFFDGIESGLIWAKIIELADLALSSGSLSENERLSNIQLCVFIVQRFNLREEEMILHHMPLVSLFILLELNQSVDDTIPDAIQIIALEVVEKLAAIVPSKAFLTVGQTAATTPKNLGKTSELRNIIKSFYAEEQGTIENDFGPLGASQVGQELMNEAIALFVKKLERNSSSAIIEVTTRALLAFIRTNPLAARVLAESNLLPRLHNLLLHKERENSSEPLSFYVVYAASVMAATAQNTINGSSLRPTFNFLDLQDLVVRLLWLHLDPESPKHHVEAVRCLWQIEAMAQIDQTVEASITKLMLSETMSGSLPKSKTYSPSCSAARRFAVLWTHSMQEKSGLREKGQRGLPKRTISAAGAGVSFNFPSDPSVVLSRPLSVVLDWMAEDGTISSAFAKLWLQDLSTLPKVFEILISHLRELRCIQSTDHSDRGTRGVLYTTRNAAADRAQCLYYLRHILRILQAASEHTWMVLASDVVVPLETSSHSEVSQIVLQGLMVQICVRILSTTDYHLVMTYDDGGDLERTVLDLLHIILQGPFSAPLRELELDILLLSLLKRNLDNLPHLLQTAFLQAITAALKLERSRAPATSRSPERNRTSRDVLQNSSSTPLVSGDLISKETVPHLVPPPGLMACLKAGFSSPKSRLILDKWVIFLRDVLPLMNDTLFQTLIPLVECFCDQIAIVFGDLCSMFSASSESSPSSPEPTIIDLLNALEQVLAKAHDKLTSEEASSAASKSPEQPQGFFGNVSNMTQGLFAGDTQQQPMRTAAANNRLAVTLCIQDTLRSCFKIWTWGLRGLHSLASDTTVAASFSYTSLRLRKRALKVLENLFAAETEVCLETLAVLYCRPNTEDYQANHVLELLNVLNGSRPKYIANRIFEAVEKRISTDPGKEAIPTSELSASETVGFLLDYIRSIEDDAMDEIWTDCMNFLRDILSNPLVYSQVLPLFLSLVGLIAEKVDRTNFGEQRKMRKELGDLFLKLLTATFTALGPNGFLADGALTQSNAKNRNMTNDMNFPTKSKDFALTLASVVEQLPIILNDSERIGSAATSVSVNVIAPAIRAKIFPKNMDQSFLELLLQLAKVSQGPKTWKKDVTDILNDSKVFAIPTDLATQYMLPILARLTIHDKERMSELLSRLSAPATAGLMFGVGAASARLEADRKTQLNLRRIALLILASDEDAYAERYRLIEEKLLELLAATPTSSPSSVTRAEVFIVLRALVLRSSPMYLSSFWPLINSELQSAILSVLPSGSDTEKYNNASIIQACMMLDTLITLDPEDFQLHEWLFITDTIDAVYRPTHSQSTALADEVAEALGSTDVDSSDVRQLHTIDGSVDTNSGKRQSFLKPLLSELEDVEASEVKLLPKRDLATRILQPFFGQLSICAFEATYGMLEPDVDGCKRLLMLDLFEENDVA